jgi:hypothetical protein
MAATNPVPWRTVWVWSLAAAAVCAGLWAVVLVGCSREAPVKSPSFRAGAEQTVSIVNDDANSAYVRVQPRTGDAFYVHRDFVNVANGTMRSASELLEKPQEEEFYFRLKEFSVIRDKIPGAFMTPSGRHVVGPWKVPHFVYDGEIAWPLYECTKADCPGRQNGAEHGYLFILANERVTVDSDPRQISREQDQERGQSYEEVMAGAQYLCPKCRERGRPSREEALKQEFRRYELPESQAMQDALDDEYKRSRQIRAQASRQ